MTRWRNKCSPRCTRRLLLLQTTRTHPPTCTAAAGSASSLHVAAECCICEHTRVDKQHMAHLAGMSDRVTSWALGQSGRVCAKHGHQHTSARAKKQVVVAVHLALTKLDDCRQAALPTPAAGLKVLKLKEHRSRGWNNGFSCGFLCKIRALSAHLTRLLRCSRTDECARSLFLREG